MAEQVTQQHFKCCYQNWMAQQGLDHDELVQALTNNQTDLDYLQLITKKVTTHYENYNASRARLAKHDGPSFLVPTWGTSIENSLLWIGGCKPSLIIRLVYTLCGSQLDAHFAEFLQGVRHGNLGDISTSQLKSIDDLRAETVKNEDKLNSREEAVDRVSLANDYTKVGESSHGEVVNRAMDTHAHDLYSVLVEADKLRLNVLKGLIDILTPLQSVEFLVAAKKLHLSLHELSKRRDISTGVTQLLNTSIPSSSDGTPPKP
ncbi:transcription factor TGA like domain-containing protein [Tanacetum coccineum]|uniref:Transcription factor TGA like domain-containing protein n=1 Tax=Tanacetum coccineum TaxID=301880 RepID=A0ABQ5III0_9ASTR